MFESQEYQLDIRDCTPTWVPPAGYVHVDPVPNANWFVLPTLPSDERETIVPPAEAA